MSFINSASFVNSVSFKPNNSNFLYNTLNQMDRLKSNVVYNIKPNQNRTLFRNLKNAPAIYLSDAIYAQNPNNYIHNNIGLIINASSDSPASPQVQQLYKDLNIDYLWVPIDDTNKLPPKDYLTKIVNYVIQRGNKGNILIHCTAGINRSALVAAAILWYTTPDRSIYWDTPKSLIDYMRTKQMVDRRTYLLINNTFYVYLLNTLK